MFSIVKKKKKNGGRNQNLTFGGQSMKKKNFNHLRMRIYKKIQH